MRVEDKRWKALLVVLGVFASCIFSDAGAQQVMPELQPKLFSRLTIR